MSRKFQTNSNYGWSKQIYSMCIIVSITAVLDCKIVAVKHIRFSFLHFHNRKFSTFLHYLKSMRKINELKKAI